MSLMIRSLDITAATLVAFQPVKPRERQHLRFARAPPLCTSRPSCQASYSDDPTMKAIQRPLHASFLCRLSSLCLRRSFPRSTIRVVFSRSFAVQRSLKANSTSSTNRKHVTVVNDDGRVRWGELSAREKAARTTQQGINLVVVIAGVALTVCFLHTSDQEHGSHCWNTGRSCRTSVHRSIFIR